MIETIDDVLKYAIKQEVNTRDFYLAAKEDTEDQKLKQFFDALIEEETKHEEILTNIREQGLYDGSVKIESFAELKKITDSHNIESMKFEKDMTMEDALQMALTREYRAQKLFEHLASLPLNQETVSLFKNLAEEEKKHHEDIQNHYKALTGTFGKEF